MKIWVLIYDVTTGAMTFLEQIPPTKIPTRNIPTHFIVFLHYFFT